MTEAIERLFVVAFFGGLALWLAQDVRRNLQTGVIRYCLSFSIRPEQTAVRGRNSFGYWGWIILKLLGTVLKLGEVQFEARSCNSH
jgi:hypothetical protein